MLCDNKKAFAQGILFWLNSVPHYFSVNVCAHEVDCNSRLQPGHFFKRLIAMYRFSTSWFSKFFMIYYNELIGISLAKKHFHLIFSYIPRKMDVKLPYNFRSMTLYRELHSKPFSFHLSSEYTSRTK